MENLTIGWEYLTGNCVATDPVSRQHAEWPPHPGRVFMAMAAAWFETGEDPSEGAALRWLESLGDPQLILPPNDSVARREVVTSFVPVNDVAGPSAALLQCAPTMTRSKQARTFPSVWLGDAHCFLQWPHAPGVQTHSAGLDLLCGKVTRIGHSSSLVRMWVASEQSTPTNHETWMPDDGLGELRVRRAFEGTLEMLDQQFNRHAREEHARINSEIDALTAAKKTVRGRGASEAKTAIDQRIQHFRECLQTIDPRLPIRPKLGLWTGYRRHSTGRQSAPAHSDFDSDVLVLTQIDGPRIPLVSTLAVTRALRGAVMKHSGIQPPPSWVCGHLDTSEPMRDGKQHLAYIPIPSVGNEFSDGHLLGAALLFPRDIARADRGKVLGQYLMDSSGTSKVVTLTLGKLGVWSLTKRDWSEPRVGLRPETWTSHPLGSKTWASVTPIVLDRFPKSDRLRSRSDWEAEVAEIIATGCRRIGLPNPATVQIGTTSWHRGTPRAAIKSRSLRGSSSVVPDGASLGDGFPFYPMKGTNASRPQIHACMRFTEPVVGPVVLCAGRFLGYGLCKPLSPGVDR